MFSSHWGLQSKGVRAVEDGTAEVSRTMTAKGLMGQTKKLELYYESSGR